MKQCLLDAAKACNDCMECDRCDLNPDKLCDNCCKCIETDEEFARISIADVVTEDTEEYLSALYKENEDEEQ